MPVRSRNSALNCEKRTDPMPRSLSGGVAARSGLPGGRMPAPAHDASLPRSPRSYTATDAPAFARKYAEVRPMIPPPMIATSDMKGL